MKKKFRPTLIALLAFQPLLGSYQILQEQNGAERLGYGEWLIDINGEWHLMQHLLRPGDVVFDVGANVGDWSIRALESEPAISLYSFEPLPTVFPDLQNRLSSFPNVKVFNLALSNQIGIGNFWHYDETYAFSALSSFYIRENLKAEHALPKSISVMQDTVAHFCEEHGIHSIDFLKIDAEGAEWIILEGAKDWVENGKVQAIQFEYGGTFEDAQITLETVFKYLERNDYLLYRIMPHGLIHIPDWHAGLENYNLANYFAIRKEALSRLHF